MPRSEHFSGSTRDETQALERDPKAGSGGWRRDKKFILTLIIAPLAVMALSALISAVIRHEIMLGKMSQVQDDNRVDVQEIKQDVKTLLRHMP